MITLSLSYKTSYIASALVSQYGFFAGTMKVYVVLFVLVMCVAQMLSR